MTISLYSKVQMVHGASCVGGGLYSRSGRVCCLTGKFFSVVKDRDDNRELLGDEDGLFSKSVTANKMTSRWGGSI